MAELDVLFVEDDLDFAEMTAGWLRSDGYRVRITTRGANAVALARELPPDIVLLDLGLPDMDGYDLAVTLRRELPEATPIIVVTGMPNAGFVANIDLMLTKPIQGELFGGLIEYVRRRRLDTVHRVP